MHVAVCLPHGLLALSREAAGATAQVRVRAAMRHEHGPHLVLAVTNDAIKIEHQHIRGGLSQRTERKGRGSNRKNGGWHGASACSVL